jgi:predicted permease
MLSDLLIRSLAAVLAVDSGMRPDSVLTFNLNLPAEYAMGQRRAAFFDQFRNRLESLPGVQAVGAITSLPLGGRGGNSSGFTVEGAPPSKYEGMEEAERMGVVGDSFQALGIALMQGRPFTDQEAFQADHRVIINETRARRFFPAQDPIGKRISLGGAWFEIVGVVRDVKGRALEDSPRPQIYTPMIPRQSGGIMTMVFRASGNPSSLVNSARSELKAIDRSLPLFDVRTMEQVVRDSVAGRRFNLFLLGLLAALALLLSTIGLSGSVSYWVSQRTREIGIRIALGAQRNNVLLQVMRQGLKLTILGVALGLVGAFALTRVLAHFLFGVTPRDPATIIGVALLLMVVALFACWLPARRATQVDPIAALRYE